MNIIENNKEENQILFTNLSQMPTQELHKFQIEISKILCERSTNQISIDDLDISIRLYQMLKKSNIKYLNQLCYLKLNELENFKIFGTKSLQELNEVMKENGLEWLS